MVKKYKFNLSAQNKLIIAGLLVSTALIMGVSYFAIDTIREKLYENYANSGQLLGRTIAIQSYEMIKDIPKNSVNKVFKYHDKVVLEGNSDISYIAHKDINGNVLYTTEYDYPQRKAETKTTLTTPVINEKGVIRGYVELGLNANLAKSISNTTKNSMLVVFAMMWFIYTVVIVLNAILIRRELRILRRGVKEISSGNFGTILENKQASGEIKELISAFNDMSQRLHIYEDFFTS